MAKRILNVVNSAYRATLEEQDDTIVWLTHAMKGGNAHVALLLQGNAIGYAGRNQDASGLRFGKRCQTQPPRLAEDLTKLVEKGVHVFYVSDDAAERGIESRELIDGIEALDRSKLPRLFADYDQIFHW
jgi:hypothetical protein